jgi:hypothetical protein
MILLVVTTVLLCTVSTTHPTSQVKPQIVQLCTHRHHRPLTLTPSFHSNPHSRLHHFQHPPQHLHPLHLLLSTPSPTTPSTIQLNPNISSTFSTLASTHSPLEVRVSYLGICISQVASEWVCASNGQALANLIKMYDGSNSGEHDPLNLIWIAEKFKDGMLFSGLL